MDAGAVKKNFSVFLLLILLLTVVFYSCKRTGSQDLEGNRYLYSNSNLRVQLEELWVRVGDRYATIDEDKGLVSVDVAEFSNNSRYIASGSSLGYDIIAWDVETGDMLMHDSTVNQIESVCFSPDDEFLLAGGKFNKLLVWKTGNWELEKEIDLKSGIEFMRYSNNGKLLAIGHIDGKISLMDAKKLEIIEEVIHTPKFKMKDFPTEDRGDVNSLDFSADDKYMISAGLDGKLEVWETENMNSIMALDGHDASIKSVRISPKMSCIASASVSQRGRDDNSIKIWDFKTGKLIHTLTFPLGMEAVDFSPDGRILAGGGREGAKEDSSGNTQGHLYFYSIPDDPVNQPILQVHKEPVFRSEYLDFNKTGDLLVSSHEDGTLRLWKITIHGGL